jgi:predicted amidohydrolase
MISLKNGCSMIIDPFGDIIAECRSFDDSIASAAIISQKLTDAGRLSLHKARRPELYREIIGREHTPEQKVVWLHTDK